MVFRNWYGASVALLSLACSSSDSDDVLGTDTREVTRNYAVLVQANYDDALDAAVDLQAAVDELVADPSAATLQAARAAWLDAREPYGQTEGFRFYDGPIDNPDDGPEGRINAWPLDELYIDYGADDANSGIINDTDNFPELSSDVIAEQNEQGAEDNISTGYHAIEFLLWGQDSSADGAGARPHTDYVTGSEGTAANQERRGQYLAIVAELLVDDLRQVADEWADDEQNYRFDFLAETSDEAIRRMLTGIGSLSGAELAGERMSTAYNNQNQEDEHSCFSDNTHVDLLMNARSIQNVYLGNYGDHDGPGIDTLVDQLDPELNEQMKEELAAGIAAIQDIPVPFDDSLTTTDGRERILAAIEALEAQTETLGTVAETLGIQLNLE